MKHILLSLALAVTLGTQALAQDRTGPLRIEITEGVIEPVVIAVAPFLAENAAAEDYATRITDVVARDLVGTGLFRDIPHQAYVSRLADFDAPVAYPDWKAINVEALVVGSVTLTSDGRLLAKFRLFDVFADAPLGDGLQFAGVAGS